MVLDTSKLFSSWKTTANGILGLFITVGAVLLATNTPILNQRLTAELTVAMAVARAVVGMLQKDAGTTVAVVPGGIPKLVDSHETPNDPAAVPVAKL